MSEPGPKKIVYLFGAGATHAELSNIGADESGLLIGDVTRRVILKANGDTAFLPHNRMFLERAADSSNIELFISLIEDNASDIPEASAAVDRLKELVEQDIKAILTTERLNAFYLHKALFELHKHNENETIIGLISLNYDTVLEEAYKWNYEGEPDYSFPFSTPKSNKPPLLKLHGSFDWENIEINGRKRKIPIIPVGINKNYLRLPYNFISSRAVAVSAYLFAEDLFLKERTDLLPQFAAFYIKLLDEIKRNMEFIKRYRNAENREVMEEFQKHILQASVEPSAIRRRDRFLKRAFDYFMDPATKGRLIGAK